MLLHAHPPHACQYWSSSLSVHEHHRPENPPAVGEDSVLISTCNCWPINLVPLPSPPTTLSSFPLWLFPSPLSVSVRVFIGEKNYFLNVQKSFLGLLLKQLSSITHWNRKGILIGNKCSRQATNWTQNLIEKWREGDMGKSRKERFSPPGLGQYIKRPSKGCYL